MTLNHLSWQIEYCLGCLGHQVLQVEVCRPEELTKHSAGLWGWFETSRRPSGSPVPDGSANTPHVQEQGPSGSKQVQDCKILQVIASSRKFNFHSLILQCPLICSTTQIVAKTTTFHDFASNPPKPQCKIKHYMKRLQMSSQAAYPVLVQTFCWDCLQWQSLL